MRIKVFVLTDPTGRRYPRSVNCGRNECVWHYYTVVNTRAKYSPREWKKRYAQGWRAVPQHIDI